MTSLTVEIITPESKLIETTCYMAIIPGICGEMGVLSEHISLMTNISDGIVKLYSDDKNIIHQFFVSKGFAHIINDRVNVLVDKATNLIDLKRDNLLTIITVNKEKLKLVTDEEEYASIQYDIKIHEMMLQAISL